MRVGIVGSRQFEDIHLMAAVVGRLFEIHGPFDFVSGGAKGADTIGQQMWEKVADFWFRDDGGIEAHRTIHLPDSKEAFEAFGQDFRARAFGRNSWIVRDSDMLIAFYVTPEPHGGTLNTHNHARRKGIPIYYHTTQGWRKENA